MTTAFDVVVDELPDDGVDLFCTRRFHALTLPEARSGCGFTLRARGSGAIIGAARFLELEPSVFTSPGRGSYGGFQIAAGAAATIAAMEDFAAAAEAELVARGARSIGVVLPPLAYDAPQTSSWVNVLLRRGYRLSRHELSYAIDVGPPFVDLVDRGNKKQLKKHERLGLVAVVLPPAAQQVAYDVLAANRAKKGNRLSMTWPAVQALCAAFPEAVRWSGVRRDGALIAAALAVRVNPRVLYVFYWGEAPDAETLSPVTALAHELYAHCLTAGIALLDVGTATLHGVPNHGLIRYKKNLGCTESLKLTFTKDIA